MNLLYVYAVKLRGERSDLIRCTQSVVIRCPSLVMLSINPHDKLQMVSPEYQ